MLMKGQHSEVFAFSKAVACAVLCYVSMSQLVYDPSSLEMMLKYC